MLTLKLVMPLMLDETFNVSTAAVDAPTSNDAPALSQVTVIYEPAVEGFQLFVVMLKVTGVLPVFLTYIVVEILFPGAI